MCLGVPGRIESCHVDRGTAMAVVRFGGDADTDEGITKTICLALTPDAAEGDWVIVHAGVAIAVLDEAAAAESLALFARMLRGV
jgi:hydrogenase expression/formation protein HypC